MLDIEPFTRHVSYTLWRLNPHPIEGKKPLKVPVHFDGTTQHSLGRPDRPGKPGYPANPAPPLTCQQAQEWLAHCRATGVGHDRPGEVGFIGIGFRPAGTGLACLDIDNCIVDGKWSQLALDMMARFPGALLELSTSGTGLHIWFSYSGASPGKHGKDATGQIELYGEGQFIAAGRVLQGDAAVDLTAAMHQLLIQFWPARTEGPRAVTANDWAEKSEAKREETKAEILDACRVLAGDNTYDYHKWVEIGMALASLGDEGNALWHEFSAWHPGYDYDDTEHKWGQLNPDHTDYRAIFKKAAAEGWANPQSKDVKIAKAMAGLGSEFNWPAEAPPVMAPRPAPAPTPAAGVVSGRAFAESEGVTDVISRPVASAPPPPAPASAVGVFGFAYGPVSVGVVAGPGMVPAPIAPPAPPSGIPAPPVVGPYTGPVAVIPGDQDESNFMEAAGGLIPATLPKLMDTFKGSEVNVRVRYDQFLGRIVIGPRNGPYRPLDDADAIRLRESLERRGFKPVGKELMDAAITLTASVNRFDSAIEWAESLVWDGVPRVTKALSHYYSAADTHYTRAVSEYLFTALAGRCLSPGCQADMALILVGLQGARKTSAVAALAPLEDSFVNLNLGARDDDTARRLRGKLVGELGEMRGRGERDIQSIREWVTRRFESWVEKFEKFETKFPRRVVLVATVNEQETLDDAEGERRWLPLTVGEVDVEGIQMDRDQLWAEGIAMWRDGGIRWQDAERLAKLEHHKYKVHDEAIEKIESWLSEIAVPAGQPITGGEFITGKPRGDEPFSITDILTYCYHLPADKHDRKWQLNVGKVLRGLGYKKHVLWIDGRSLKRWVRSDLPA